MFSDRFPRSRVLATNRFADQINRRGEACLIVAASEQWLDVALGNIECRCVRQRAFETVTDLDKHFAILNEYKEHNAIAAILLTDTPCLCHALGIVRNIRVTLHFRKNRNHSLIRSFPLKLRELLVET